MIKSFMIKNNLLIFKVLFTWISLGLISCSSTETLNVQFSSAIDITLSLKDI